VSRMRGQWVCQEPGWWSGGWLNHPHTFAVCKEADGHWHTYVKHEAPPGDSKHRTMRDAMRATERLASR
jgi:hypothetical protein